MRKPFYRSAVKAWYVTHQGKQIRLVKGPKAETKDAAFREWHRMMGEASDGISVQELADRFLKFVEVANSKVTLEWYQFYLKSFLELHAKTPVANLKKHHATEWLHSLVKRGWADNSQACSVRAVKRLFKWSEDEELIVKNPFRTLKAPEYKPRDARVTEEDWALLISTLSENDPFRLFLTCLKATGCRPFELRTVEARHHQGRCWIFEVEESKGKRRRRAVTLPRFVHEISLELAAKHKKGPLFRNSRGRPWTRDAIGCRMKRLSRKLGKRFFAYAFRHEYISSGIEKGIDLITLSNLVGHSDLSMIKRVYSHLDSNSEHMIQAANLAAGVQQ